jgi:hypothetical protein
MSDLNEKISDLRVSQIETHTLIRNLTDKVDKYVESDDIRHRDLVEFRVEASKNLASVAAIVQDIKKEVDTAVKTDIPKLQQDVSGHGAKINSHSWLLRAVIGATLIAVLGTTVTGLTTCNTRDAEAVIIHESNDEVSDADGDFE